MYDQSFEVRLLLNLFTIVYVDTHEAILFISWGLLLQKWNIIDDDKLVLRVDLQLNFANFKLFMEGQVRKPFLNLIYKHEATKHG